MQRATAFAVGLNDLLSDRLGQRRAISVNQCEVGPLLALRVEHGPQVTQLMPEQFRPVRDGVLQLGMLRTATGSFGCVRMADQNADTDQLLDYLATIQQNASLLLVGFIFLLYPGFPESTQ